MPQNSLITTWLGFAIQQMAAESYIHKAFSGKLTLGEVLLLGNNNVNNVPGASPTDPNLSGKTRFANVLADRFLATYDIIDHHANDATGFSATLMRDRTTGEYMLSFPARNTETKLKAATTNVTGRMVYSLLARTERSSRKGSHSVSWQRWSTITRPRSGTYCR